MPNRSDRHLLLVAIDFGLAVVVFLGAIWIRFGNDFVRTWEVIIGLPSVEFSAAALAAGTVTMFWAGGVYRTERFWSVRAEVGAVLRSMVSASLIIMSLLYVFRYEDFSRLALGGYLIFMTAAATSVRLVLRRTDTESGRRTRVVLVGTHDARRILDRLERLHDGPAHVVGFVGERAPDPPFPERLGELLDLPRVLAEHIVDEVIVCLPVEKWGMLNAIAGVCEEQGKAMRVPVDVVGYAMRRGLIEDLDTIPMLSLVSTPSGHFELMAKRAIDVAVSGTLVLLLLPLHIVLSVMLFLTQGRPVIFRQARSGLNGRVFRVLKYRTMDLDADEQKLELMAQNERVGPAFKISNDPRITRIGRLLRVASIDELPQLWNVLVGDMSLVGPRPQPVEEVMEYDPWHRRRLTVKPGITGLWQVTSRHDPSFDVWVDLDLEYIDRWSVWLDLKILARTPIALIRSPGQ